MKCEFCYREAEFGLDGEDIIVCADHYDEISESLEMGKEMADVFETIISPIDK